MAGSAETEHPVGCRWLHYEWQRGGNWSKSTIELPPTEQAPDFWDYRNDPDLPNGPEGWWDREVNRVLAELRGTGGADPRTISPSSGFGRHARRLAAVIQGSARSRGSPSGMKRRRNASAR